ncbi:NAD(+) synthase [Helcococcus kunzii]
MFKNFIRVASANIKTKLLNVNENKNEMLKFFEYSGKNDVDLILFPELTLTGVSGGDLIISKEIIEKCEKAILDLSEASKKYNTIFVFGMPIRSQNKFYNAMILLQKGEILNIVIKNKLSMDEKRIFSDFANNGFIETNLFSNKDEAYHVIYGKDTLTSKNKDINIQLIFENVAFTYDSKIHNSTNILLIPGSMPANMNSISQNSEKLKSLSAFTNTAILYAGASNYESSTSSTYSSQKYILENGLLLEKGKLFNNGIVITEINLDEVQSRSNNEENIYGFEFDFSKTDIKLRRKIDKYPYFPKDNFDESMRNILELQSEALARRLRQIPDNKIFIGLSGGLDSTLGLIVASLAYYKLGLDSKNIYTVTMPGLGTSDRTKHNAINLAKAYNTTFKEISIVDSVKQHFKDIEHDENDFSVTYENSQARERTQVLMDLSNKYGGIVLGTGNMSEIVLGWSTFNGDHMSMYNVNCGIPKTLLREIVRYVANNTNNDLLKDTLLDIIDTPISPELLPTGDDGNIKQKTEDNVGPYELHDFFTYHLIKNKSKINDIRFMAIEAFSDKYSEEIIDKYLNKFLWRLQTQQFKRNTSVDGPQILEYSLNSRLGFVMPSDVDPNSLTL